MTKITSFSNPKIKDVAQLRESRERKKTGLTVIDGVREVKAALKAGVVIKTLYICRDLYKEDFKANAKIEVIDVSKEVFEKISFGDRAEGLLAVGKVQTATIEHFKLKPKPLLMLIESVEKPGNLGAILRTCDAAGIDALFVSDPATDVFNPNVIRASLGTVFTVPVVLATKEKTLEYFKSCGLKIVATTPSAKKNYTAVDFKSGAVIVIGSEKDGLSDFWLNASDDKIVIPMKGQADSLNTSVAAALVAYEALRQREGR